MEAWRRFEIGKMAIGNARARGRGAPRGRRKRGIVWRDAIAAVGHLWCLGERMLRCADGVGWSVRNEDHDAGRKKEEPVARPFRSTRLWPSTSHYPLPISLGTESCCDLLATRQ